MLTFRALFALPGVVVHELGHYLFCRLCGVEVREVVFFEPEGPAGHVVHVVPNRLPQHALIVGGPLLVNSTLAFLFFRGAVGSLGALPSLSGVAASDDVIQIVLQLLLALPLGLSIGLQAIPSRADTASFWTVALDHLRRGRILAVLAVPPVALLLVVNLLRRYWIDWLYVAVLAVAAIWLPVGW